VRHAFQLKQSWRSMQRSAAAAFKLRVNNYDREGHALVIAESLMFEHRSDPLLPRRLFILRVSRHGLVAALIVLGSLLVGTLGYRALEQMAWIDALLNASMILSGMGPASSLKTWEGKLFASLFALYSALVLLVVAGVMLAPLAHRLLHRFHLDRAERDSH
jgi:hypothetical protein